MAIGDMHKISVKIGRSSEDMIADRQTHRQTRSSQYSASRTRCRAAARLIPGATAGALLMLDAASAGARTLAETTPRAPLSHAVVVAVISSASPVNQHAAQHRLHAHRPTTDRLSFISLLSTALYSRACGGVVVRALDLRLKRSPVRISAVSP